LFDGLLSKLYSVNLSPDIRLRNSVDLFLMVAFRFLIWGGPKPMVSEHRIRRISA
jgi:hypothetical protein